jgi:5'(3')-deoxyribonucleotidase
MDEVIAGSLESFTPPHNIEEDRYRRVNGWQDVGEIFL